MKIISHKIFSFHFIHGSEGIMKGSQFDWVHHFRFTYAITVIQLHFSKKNHLMTVEFELWNSAWKAEADLWTFFVLKNMLFSIEIKKIVWSHLRNFLNRAMDFQLRKSINLIKNFFFKFVLDFSIFLVKI